MLTENREIDQITVEKDGTILVREKIIILRDGAEIAVSYHRTSHRPGDDVATADAKVQAVSSAVWTAETVAAYQSKMSALAD